MAVRMSKENHWTPTAELIDRYFQVEEVKSERYTNLARLVLTFFYFIIILGIKKEIPELSFKVLVWATAASMIYSLWLCYYLRKGSYRWWLKYVSVAVDIFILSFFLYQIGSYRTFKTEAFMLYFIWIGLAVVRFSPKLTFLAGVLSFVCYVLMVFAAIQTGSVEFGTITEEFTTQKVSGINIGLKLLFLALFTGVATYVSGFYKKLRENIIEGEIRKEKAKQLSDVIKEIA